MCNGVYTQSVQGDKGCELLTEHMLIIEVSFFSDTLYLGKKLILDVFGNSQ